MNKLFFTPLFFLSLFTSTLLAQNPATGLNGHVLDENNAPLPFANVVLFHAVDSVMVKAGYSDEDGSYAFQAIPAGDYYLHITFVGYEPHFSNTVQVTEDKMTTVEPVTMTANATELGEVVVATKKPLVEVKPDKTVFNVEGSINAIGNDALELLRKAPGVVVDNNEQLMLVGKSGVQVYIDGKQSVLRGDDLANYLKSLQSSQIESIEIITQPSSKYDASGNAGIINIRLIKDKSLGTNATISLSHNQAIHGRTNANVNFNNRSKALNLFGNVNYAFGQSSYYNMFRRTTPAIYARQDNNGHNEWNNLSLRLGADLYTGKFSTVGVLFDGYTNNGESSNSIQTLISPDPQTPTTEILLGSNDGDNDRDNYNINGNYRYDNRKGTVLNIDLDYGSFASKGNSYQPNYYYDAGTGDLTDTRIFASNSPTTIDIRTFKVDYEHNLWGGKAGVGGKIAFVSTDNTYEFYNVIDGNEILDTDRSNQFTYDEWVNAAYVNYGKQWKKIGMQLGVRMEQTDSKGDLTSYKPENDEEVKQNYVDFFPSAGITYSLNEKNSLRLMYSRRIDRPNYQDLNPFEFKLDEITYRKGNPFLRPQYSNSVSLSHTFKQMLNTSLSYSHTKDLMAELTDTSGTSGSAFLTKENIANQDVFGLNVSYPFSISKSWNVFANAGVTNTHNKADFGDGKIVDITATTFNGYIQNTFSLPGKFTLELSGWYNSPGIWGGNFASGAMWSVDAGLQKKILNERGTIKIGVSDIFHSQEWSGDNTFGGLDIHAMGGWESRQFKINFTYLAGNTQVKGTRRRTTGLDNESKRIQSENR